MGIANKIKNLLRYIKHGGVTYVTITQVKKEDSLADKVILVTGGSSGIGYAIAEKALDCGASVIITGRNEAKLLKAISELNSEKVKGIVWDIEDCEHIAQNFKKATEIFGRIDIAINNAGVWSPKQWEQINEADWDKILDINLKGLFFMCQAEALYFKNIKDLNKIINITSMDGIYAQFHPYNASKFGANGLTKGLAKKMINNNIVVNAIAPGPVRTDLNEAFLKELGDNYYWSQPLNKRFVLKEEIAEMAAYLCSDAANAIVGQVISVDGGY